MTTYTVKSTHRNQPGMSVTLLQHGTAAQTLKIVDQMFERRSSGYTCHVYRETSKGLEQVHCTTPGRSEWFHVYDETKQEAAS